MAPTVWGSLAGLAGLAGYIPYLRDAWRRTSDPDPAAWLVWTIEYGILLAVQAAQHPPWAALSLAMLQLAGTVLVFAVLAVRGGWRFGAGRWAVFGGAAAAMGLWWLTRAPALAMCLALATEGGGMVLVILGAYRSPGHETVLTWYIFVSAGLLDLPALRHTPPLLYAYPVFFIVMGAGVLMATALGVRAESARPGGCRASRHLSGPARSSGLSCEPHTDRASSLRVTRPEVPAERHALRQPAGPMTADDQVSAASRLPPCAPKSRGPRQPG